MNQVRRISHYEFNLSDKIGSGSKSTVYVGRLVFDSGNDLEGRQRVAVKHIDLGTLDELSLWLLQNEKRALLRLHHPNVIKLLELVERERDCYMIFPYYSSGSLADLLKRRGGRLPEPEAMRLFSRLMHGYVHLYEEGVLHRDLKPENILLEGSSFMPIISDFGFCRLPNEELPSSFSYIVGTPSYMAPEVLIKNQYSSKADVWSLGTILYEMLVGEGYDEGREVTQAMLDIRKHGLSFPPNISFETQYLIKDMMSLSPNDRLDVRDVIARLPAQQERKIINPIRPRNATFVSESITNQEPTARRLATHESEKETANGCLPSRYEQKTYRKIEHLQQNIHAVQTAGRNLNFSPRVELNTRFHQPSPLRTFVNVKPQTSNVLRTEVHPPKEVHEIGPRRFQPLQRVPLVYNPLQRIQHAKSPSPYAQTIETRPVKPQTTRYTIDTSGTMHGQPVRVTPTSTTWLRRPSAS